MCNQQDYSGVQKIKLKTQLNYRENIGNNTFHQEKNYKYSISCLSCAFSTSWKYKCKSVKYSVIHCSFLLYWWFHLIHCFGCKIQIGQPAIVKAAANLVRLLSYQNQVILFPHLCIGNIFMRPIPLKIEEPENFLGQCSYLFQFS